MKSKTNIYQKIFSYFSKLNLQELTLEEVLGAYLDLKQLEVSEDFFNSLFNLALYNAGYILKMNVWEKEVDLPKVNIESLSENDDQLAKRKEILQKIGYTTNSYISIKGTSIHLDRVSKHIDLGDNWFYSRALCS